MIRRWALDVECSAFSSAGLVQWPESVGGRTFSLKEHGCKMQGGHVIIADWPVQFRPADAPLLEEALRKAATIDVDEVPARVFTAEHLAAIALRTGRSKDKARRLQFIEARALNSEKFQAIIKRHGLSDGWERFQKQFDNNER
jgi:hypothetical protein